MVAKKGKKKRKQYVKATDAALADAQLKSFEQSIEKEIDEYIQKHAVVQKVSDTISKYQDLSERERQFARRYSVEWKSMKGWEKEFALSWDTLSRMIAKPRFQQLVKELRDDYTQFTVSKQLILLTAALDVYTHILRDTLVTDDNISTIRLAAQDVLRFFRPGGGPDPFSETHTTFNVNMGQDNQRPLSNEEKIALEREKADRAYELEMFMAQRPEAFAGSKDGNDN